MEGQLDIGTAPQRLTLEQFVRAVKLRPVFAVDSLGPERIVLRLGVAGPEIEIAAHLTDGEVRLAFAVVTP